VLGPDNGVSWASSDDSVGLILAVLSPFSCWFFLDTDIGLAYNLRGMLPVELTGRIA
jgi:hypothetical protein